MNTLPALIALAIAVASNGVLAQNTKIYRCGADGRELSQKPCPEGQVLTPKAAAPDAEQVRQAQELARREEKLGDKMAAERRQREADEARNAAGAIGIYGRGKPTLEPVPPTSAASKSAGKKRNKKAQTTHKPEGFTATSPKSAKQGKGASDASVKP